MTDSTKRFQELSEELSKVVHDDSDDRLNTLKVLTKTYREKGFDKHQSWEHLLLNIDKLERLFGSEAIIAVLASALLEIEQMQADKEKSD